MSEFPITFGVCPECGRRGNMEPTSLEDYQSENNGEVGHGYELKLFRGRYLCKLCIEKIEDDEESQRQVELDNRDQELRSKCGFRRSYS